ncbi:LacI family transcriptional regulator [Arsenicitalea aurantiaca]|uniref:LacI family transcriptional regulator n=1 Tax=Arsenicitalea aurantiaca TaxID=1783274 RepID=UPI003CC7D758
MAEITGLAVTTVSRALNNAPELAAETRERVRRVADEIGYLPDRTALRLKTGRTHVISFILDPHDELLGFGQSMVSGLIAALRDTPYHLVITPNFRNVDPIEPVRYIIRNRMADGVIFSRIVPDDARVKLLLETGLPFVTHGRTALGVEHAFVDYDNEAFARLAVARLVRRGRRRLAILVPPEPLSFGLHLRSGFSAETTAARVSGRILDTPSLDDSTEAIARAVTAMLQAPDAPDGFVCSGDAAALAVMAGIADAGLRVGVDIDIVAKQTSPVLAQLRPQVDAIAEDIGLAGLQLGEALLKAIGGTPPEKLQILHRPDITQFDVDGPYPQRPRPFG